MSMKSRSSSRASRRSGSQRSVSSQRRVERIRSSKSAANKTASSSSCPDGVAKGMSIPCATLLIIAVCILIHLELLDLPLLYVKNSCAGLYQVFYLQEFSRIFLCHFVHTSNSELAFHVISFLWKGQQLEKCCGVVYFLVMILLFVPCCSFILFIIHKILADAMDPAFITQCFCGLGSINFALKVIKMYQSGDGGVQCMFGDYLCIKLKYVGWLEILLSHLVSTASTIAANVAGVLVGILYISGILHFIIETIVTLPTGNSRFMATITSFGKASYFGLGSRLSSLSAKISLGGKSSSRLKSKPSSIKSAQNVGQEDSESVNSDE